MGAICPVHFGRRCSVLGIQDAEPALLLFVWFRVFVRTACGEHFAQRVKIAKAGQRGRHQEMAFAEFVPGIDQEQSFLGGLLGMSIDY